MIDQAYGSTQKKIFEPVSEQFDSGQCQTEACRPQTFLSVSVTEGWTAGGPELLPSSSIGSDIKAWCWWSHELFQQNWPVSISGVSVIWCSSSDRRGGNTNMALTHGHAHNRSLPGCSKTLSGGCRPARGNHRTPCSDAGSPAVLYCTYLVCVRSGNPTK